MSDLIIAPSARKHGITDSDIRHAYNNPIRLFELDEGLTMIIGSSADGGLHEIGIIEGDTANVVVHAMPARNKFLRR